MITEKYILPEWSLSYLINSDGSGLEESDRLEVDRFVHEQLKENDCFIVTMPDNDEPYFSSYNDINQLASNVYECEVIISNN